jgi:23S rRNA pseudouridine2605 synthase
MDATAKEGGFVNMLEGSNAEHEKKNRRIMKDKQENKQPEEASLPGERLARYLAHAGVASRRRAEELIAAGRVRVNGETITTQGARVDPTHDRILVDGRLVQSASEHVYLLLHKPSGYVTTASDPEGRPTVLDLLPPELRALRVYPVGRLDRDTSGLLLITNDGEFALRLSHPRYRTEKQYEALVQGLLSDAELRALRRGVQITEDDGHKHQTAPARASVLEKRGSESLLLLTIQEGHKRQIRRMLLAVGHTVIQLQRVAVGPLSLQDLPVGKWRHLTVAEVAALMDSKSFEE